MEKGREVVRVMDKKAREERATIREEAILWFSQKLEGVVGSN